MLMEVINTAAVLTVAEQELYARLTQAITQHDIPELERLLTDPNIAKVLHFNGADGKLLCRWQLTEMIQQ